ncbi:MAG: hypothetical protein ABIS07_12010 [Dokdonella sp.]
MHRKKNAGSGFVRAGRSHRTPIACLSAAMLAAGVAIASAGAPVLDGHVIAGGGGSSQSPGGCLSLEGTMGESAVGASSGGVYSLSAGFWAGVGYQQRGSIFNNGFEECH